MCCLARGMNTYGVFHIHGMKCFLLPSSRPWHQKWQISYGYDRPHPHFRDNVVERTTRFGAFKQVVDTFMKDSPHYLWYLHWNSIAGGNIHLTTLSDPARQLLNCCDHVIIDLPSLQIGCKWRVRLRRVIEVSFVRIAKTYLLRYKCTRSVILNTHLLHSKSPWAQWDLLLSKYAWYVYFRHTKLFKISSGQYHLLVNFGWCTTFTHTMLTLTCSAFHNIR